MHAPLDDNTGWLHRVSGADGYGHAACVQQKAFYGDKDGAYELSFEPVDSDASSSSHRIKVKINNSEVVLDGYVMPSEPVNRSNGILFNNCPEGDVTGADLAACTVWEGMIYANNAGKIDLLPPQGADAAPEILLAGFGPSLTESSRMGSKEGHGRPLGRVHLERLPLMSDEPVLLVTGGSRGIGASVCRKAAAAGWRVMINYVSNESAARPLPPKSSCRRHCRDRSG
jgi:hypothetical protein